MLDWGAGDITRALSHALKNRDTAAPPPRGAWGWDLKARKGVPGREADRCRGISAGVFWETEMFGCSWTAGQMVGGNGVMVGEPPEALIISLGFPRQEVGSREGFKQVACDSWAVCPEAANEAVM